MPAFLPSLIKATNIQQGQENEYHLGYKVFHSKELIPQDYEAHLDQLRRFTCYHIPRRTFKVEVTDSGHLITTNMEENTPVKEYTVFDLDIPAMFFSWITYEPITDYLGTTFSYAQGFDRMDPNNIDQNWKMTNLFHEEYNHQYAHVSIFCNENLGIAVFAFRGTEGYSHLRTPAWSKQWIKNFKCYPKEWKIGDEKCRVHCGYFEQYQVNRKKILHQAKIYLQKGYSIVCTGHSQGSAVASYAVTDIAYSLHVDPHRLYCIVFGSPSVGDKSFVTIFNHLLLPSHTTRWVTRLKEKCVEDIITTTPPKIFKYEHGIQNPKFLEGNLQYAMNPKPIKGVNYQCAFFIPYSYGLMLHCQQVYMDGLLDLFITERK